MRFLIFLIIGAIAGWLSGEVVYGDGFGLIGNLIVGVIGAFVGGILLDFFGVDTKKSTGMFGEFVTSFIGATAFLFIVNLIF